MENLFVIFPPGCAGHHLANIISTSKRFNKLYSTDVYTNLTTTAHPVKHRNYELTVDEFLAAQNQSNVFCTHLAEYLMAQSLTEQYLQNRKYVIIETPTDSRNSFFMDRVSNLYPVYQSEYFFEEVSMLYSIQYISLLFNETDMTSITVDKIFSEDITPLINKLNLELGLDLNADEVESIHSSWIEKNKRFL